MLPVIIFFVQCISDHLQVCFIPQEIGIAGIYEYGFYIMLFNVLRIGSIIMVTMLTIRPLKKNQGKILFYTVAGFGICIICFALSQVFWLSFLSLMIAGCMDGVSVIVRSTILQLKTPDELRGRVMSVNSMFINSSNELGQFESGLAAKLMGTVTSVIFGGFMTLAVVVVTWFKAPALRKMEY